MDWDRPRPVLRPSHRCPIHRRRNEIRIPAWKCLSASAKLRSARRVRPAGLEQIRRLQRFLNPATSLSSECRQSGTWLRKGLKLVGLRIALVTAPTHGHPVSFPPNAFAMDARVDASARGRSPLPDPQPWLRKSSRERWGVVGGQPPVLHRPCPDPDVLSATDSICRIR